MSDEPIHYRETRYGFEYGAAGVERVFNDKGRVVLRILTPRQEASIYVTKTGLIRFGTPTKRTKTTDPLTTLT